MKETTKIMPVINQKIKDKRKELKITQEEFTKIINKSIATVRRYDGGDTIPENTLILICDKLNLDIEELIKLQNLQNIMTEEKFYIELINKLIHPFIKKNTSQSEEIYINSVIKRLSFIYNAFRYIEKDEISVEYKNNKFYIYNIFRPEIDAEDIIDTFDILTTEQADKFINDMQEYFEFKTERLRKEKLNK